MIQQDTQRINAEADAICEAREELEQELSDISAKHWRDTAVDRINDAARASHYVYSITPTSRSTDHLRVAWWLIVSAGQLTAGDADAGKVAQRLRDMADDLEKFSA